jgi:hypothetical protein
LGFKCHKCQLEENVTCQFGLSFWPHLVLVEAMILKFVVSVSVFLFGTEKGNETAEVINNVVYCSKYSIFYVTLYCFTSIGVTIDNLNISQIQNKQDLLSFFSSCFLFHVVFLFVFPLLHLVCIIRLYDHDRLPCIIHNV